MVSFLLAAGSVRADSATPNEDAFAPAAVVGGLIPRSLTGVPGDPAKGKAVILDRKLGNCLSCHSMPIPEDADPGNVGPDLRGVASRSNEVLLRTRLVNPKLLNPATIMPAYYRIDHLHRVMTEFSGKPILSAQQVEDVVAFLMTLK